jgi:DnaA family protein
MTQLVLPVRLADHAHLDNFLVQDTAALIVQAVRDCAHGAEDEWLFLAGNAGSGRSHLLQAACHELQSACHESMQAGTADARYLPLRLLRDADAADVLANIEAATLVCIDDIDTVVGIKSWELALFHALNRLRDNKRSVMFAATQPPAALAIELPDLKSRLSWATVYRLPDLDDAGKSALLVFRAQQRGMTMSNDVADYIVQRGNRDTAALMDVLDMLDQQSLAQSRRITIPFVKSVTHW